MNISAEKLGLIEWIVKLNDISIIEQLKVVYNKNDVKESRRISILEKKSIQRGLKDIKEGRVHSHELVKDIYEKYL